ncbi:MAG: ATP-binding protein [Lachnospiraceae bacterium]|nr:ATP-binding protein [Lachnospiraceae bacterium]
MIKRVFRQMLFSQILSTLAVTLCMLIDSIMIGRFLGVDAMAAYGFANPILLAFTAIGCMLSNGIQYVCSSYMGKGDTRSIDKCYTTVLIVGIGIAVLGMALIFAFIRPLAGVLGATEGTEIHEMTQRYLLGFLIGAPAVIGAQIMIPYLQMAGEQKMLIIAVGAMTAADVLFDFLAVKAFDMGIFGMGLASSLSYIFAFGIGLTYFLSKRCIYKFNFRFFDFSQMKGIAVGGGSAAVNQASFTFLILLVNNLLRSFGGNTAVAAYSVISTMANVCYAFGSGVGSIGLMLGGIFYGEEDRGSIYTVVRTAVRYALILDIAVIALFMLIARPVASLFIADDPDTLALTAHGFRIFLLSILPSCLNTTFKNYYTGVKRIAFANSISFLQNFLMPAVCAVALAQIFGTDGIWMAFAGGELLALVIFSAVLWKFHGGVSLSAETYSYLPADFGAAPEDSLELSIRSADEVISASRTAEEFCKAKGQSARMSYFMALCIEEMANNVVSYGFTEGRDNLIELRLIKKEDRWILRLRDNCESFDPVHYMELHKTEDDPTSHLGIRMVFAVVKDAKYVNSLGLNNLTLTL